MSVPATDLDRVRQFCQGQVPSHMQDLLRVEYRVRGRTVTIVECRPPSHAEAGAEWEDFPQARLKYDDRLQGWTLYCFDRNSRAHRYELTAPGQPIDRLLAEYDEDPTCIFKG